MQLRELGRTGLRVSPLGFGAAPLGGLYGELDREAGIATVRRAIHRGITLFDSSSYYGDSEEVLGRALRAGYRDRILLSTKAGRLSRTEFDFSPAQLRRSLDNSLRLLGTDYVDIFLAHDIEFAPNLEYVFSETTAALHELKQAGKCRFVGMSGLPLAALIPALERCQLDVVLSYCHFHLFDTTLLTTLLPVAERHGTAIINASPLSMGLLTQATPPAWHPADDSIKAACRAAAQICASRGADLATLAVQYVVRESRLPTTLVGIKIGVELDRNLAALDLPLDEDLLKDVLAIFEPVSNRSWPSGQFPAP